MQCLEWSVYRETHHLPWCPHRGVGIDKNDLVLLLTYWCSSNQAAEAAFYDTPYCKLQVRLHPEEMVETETQTFLCKTVY
ncbi:hypothetical protein EV1_039807 [Malus domestica]